MHWRSSGQTRSGCICLHSSTSNKDLINDKFNILSGNHNHCYNIKLNILKLAVYLKIFRGFLAIDGYKKKEGI